MHNIYELIKKGGIFYDVPGKNIEECLKNICTKLNLPENLSKDLFLSELLKREEMLSTAVGNGIAIPHTRPLLLKESDSQRIFVCFPKEFLDMDAPDGRKVSALFILLTSNSEDHLLVLKQFARMIQNVEVRRAIEQQSPEEEFLECIKKYQ